MGEQPEAFLTWCRPGSAGRLPPTPSRWPEHLGQVQELCEQLGELQPSPVDREGSEVVPVVPTMLPFWYVDATVAGRMGWL